MSKLLGTNTVRFAPKQLRMFIMRACMHQSIEEVRWVLPCNINATIWMYMFGCKPPMHTTHTCLTIHCSRNESACCPAIAHRHLGIERASTPKDPKKGNRVYNDKNQV